MEGCVAGGSHAVHPIQGASMSRFPSRSILAAVAIAALALGCRQPQTGGFVCKANGRDAIEQENIYWAREWAFDKVDFRFCRNQKCAVTVEATTECDLPDIKECIAHRIAAANGLLVEREADATVKLTCVVTKVHFAKYEQVTLPNVAVGTFEGILAVAEAGPGGARRTLKLAGYSRKGF
jgi:hypothetical protein